MSTRATRKKRQNGKTGLVLICERPVHGIEPSPENDLIYSPVNEDDPAIVQLAESIRQHGVREPLVITEDGFILSGHRRHKAAILAGLYHVPCRIEPIRREDDIDRFIVLLREHNRQREKTLDEKLRESVIPAEPEEAYQALTDYRKQRSAIDANDLMRISPAYGRARSKITAAKEPFLAAIEAVIERMRDFLPLSVRQIHYQLLNDPPLIHAKKPDSKYSNTLNCYKALDELLTRARVARRIPMDVIADETRPVTVWRVDHEPSAFLTRELETFLRTYSRDLMQSQPNHVEIVGEKNTIASIIEPISMEYCIPMTIGRGFCSLPPRDKMMQRFEKSGCDKLVVLVLGDFDPDGEAIAESFIRSLRDDFYADPKRLVGIKAGLTAEQVREFKLPPQMVAKESSSNYRRFVEKYGSNTYELEAIQPEDLQRVLEEAIKAVIDIDAFNHEVQKEKSDAEWLENARRRARAALAGIVD